MSESRYKRPSKPNQFTSEQIGGLDKVRHRIALMIALAIVMAAIVGAALLLSKIP